MTFCWLGLHSWGRWWNDPVTMRDGNTVHAQHRECHSCGKKQIKRIYVGA